MIAAGRSPEFPPTPGLATLEFVMHTTILFRRLFAVLALALLTPAAMFAADRVATNEPIVPALAHISWSAILAGAVVSLACHVALSTLGFGIGAASVDAYDLKNPTKGVPTILFVWMFVAGLISLFAGGWVAGRLAGTVPFDSTIHGVITWALATVLIFILATTSLGYIVGGTFRLLGEGASTAARAAATVMPSAAQMAKDAVAENVPALDWKSIKREAEELLHEAAPDEKHGSNAGGEGAGKKGENRSAKAIENANEVSGEMIAKVYGVVRDGISSADREAILKAITARTGVTQDEANKTLDQWEKTYREAKRQYQTVVTKAEQTARETADSATTAISRIAIWTFASLLFGMVVAGLGGNLGSMYFRIDEARAPIAVSSK